MDDYPQWDVSLWMKEFNNPRWKLSRSISTEDFPLERILVQD